MALTAALGCLPKAAASDLVGPHQTITMGYSHILGCIVLLLIFVTLGHTSLLAIFKRIYGTVLEAVSQCPHPALVSGLVTEKLNQSLSTNGKTMSSSCERDALFANGDTTAVKSQLNQYSQKLSCLRIFANIFIQ